MEEIFGLDQKIDARLANLADRFTSGLKDIGIYLLAPLSYKKHEPQVIFHFPGLLSYVALRSFNISEETAEVIATQCELLWALHHLRHDLPWDPAGFRCTRPSLQYPNVEMGTFGFHLQMVQNQQFLEESQDILSPEDMLMISGILNQTSLRMANKRITDLSEIDDGYQEQTFVHLCLLSISLIEILRHETVNTKELRDILVALAETRQVAVLKRALDDLEDFGISVDQEMISMDDLQRLFGEYSPTEQNLRAAFKSLFESNISSFDVSRSTWYETLKETGLLTILEQSEKALMARSLSRINDSRIESDIATKLQQLLQHR